MSQELNICHYYLLVLFDFEAAQWPVSGGFIPPPSVVHFKVDYSNPWAPILLNPEAFFHLLVHFIPSLWCPLPAPPSKWNYIHLLAQSITNVHTLSRVKTHTHTGPYFVIDDVTSHHILPTVNSFLTQIQLQTFVFYALRLVTLIGND